MPVLIFGLERNVKLPADKLKRSFLLLQKDVEEDAIGNSDGMQQAKESHQYDSYGDDGCIDCIIVNVICVRQGLDSQDERKMPSHCCNKR